MNGGGGFLQGARTWEDGNWKYCGGILFYRAPVQGHGKMKVLWGILFYRALVQGHEKMDVLWGILFDLKITIFCVAS